MRTLLKKHNEIAYKKVMAALETSDKTCVVHPTGTGKSYIIAAVAESFKMVLVLAPNDFILEQQKKVMAWNKGVTYRNYQWLIHNVTEITDKYDLIVLDEFHRTGADVWGAAVCLLIESQPQAKVLGTTATHIRYLDKERNMADEMFDGHIASEMTLADAWNRDILPQPRYVCGLFRWDKMMDEARDAINRSRRLSKEEKRDRIFRLNNAHLHWELSYGMPAILRKHLDRSARRVIVFCSHIKDIEEMRGQVLYWFHEAGFKLAGTYILHSNMTDADQVEQMKQFESDQKQGVQLIFSVNILNEGLHIPSVDAVVMLRTTASRIIFLQQMGRCLTAGKSIKPLVLDMVDNITTTTAIGDILAEYDQLQAAAEKEGREPRPFEVIDYTLGIRDVIKKLVPEAFTVEERIKILMDFVDKHGRLPKHSEPDVYRHWIYLYKFCSDIPEVKALIKMFHRLTTSEKADAFRKFYDTNNRLPRRDDGSDEEWLRNWWDQQCRRHPEDPLVQEYTAKEQARIEREKEEKRQQYVQTIHEKMTQGETCITRMQEFKWLTRNYPEHPDTLAIVKQYVKTMSKRKSIDEILDEVEAICEKTGYVISTNDNYKLYQKWTRVKYRYPDNPRVKTIIGKYPVNDKNDEFTQTVAKDYITFWQNNGRRPNKNDGKIYNRWNAQLSRHRDHPAIQEAIAITGYTCKDNKYENGRLTEDEIVRRVEVLTVFAHDKQRQPNSYHKDETDMNTYLNSLRQPPYCDRDDVKQLLALFNSFKPVLESNEKVLADYIQFCETNKRLPSRFSKDPDEVELYKKVKGRKALIIDPEYIRITEQYKHRRMDETEEQRIVIEHCERTGFRPSKNSASEEVYRAWQNIIRTNPTLANEIKDKYEIFKNKKET